jgi:hypothetical protein
LSFCADINDRMLSGDMHTVTEELPNELPPSPPLMEIPAMPAGGAFQASHRESAMTSSSVPLILLSPDRMAPRDRDKRLASPRSLAGGMSANAADPTTKTSGGEEECATAVDKAPKRCRSLSAHVVVDGLALVKTWLPTPPAFAPLLPPPGAPPVPLGDDSCRGPINLTSSAMPSATGDLDKNSSASRSCLCDAACNETSAPFAALLLPLLRVAMPFIVTTEDANRQTCPPPATEVAAGLARVLAPDRVMPNLCIHGPVERLPSSPGAIEVLFR